ncbi:MAG: hypothetical protein RR623_09030 [Bacilli bacterium]
MFEVVKSVFFATLIVIMLCFSVNLIHTEIIKYKENKKMSRIRIESYKKSTEIKDKEIEKAIKKSTDMLYDGIFEKDLFSNGK